MIKSGWTTVKDWIGTIPGLSQAISLAKSGWTSVKNWIGTIPALDQAIKLAKKDWTSLSSWLGIGTLTENIKLAKSGWTSISNFVGTSVSVGVYEDSQRAYERSYSDEAMYKSMSTFYREYVEPTLKEIASDTKRQADKEEQTIVQIGNRTITDAVVTQQSANGYRFVTP